MDPPLFWGVGKPNVFSVPLFIRLQTTSHFCNGAVEIAVQWLIDHDCACPHRISPYTGYLFVALYLLFKKLIN